MTLRTAVFYATREGQARRVAERVAADLRTQSLDVDLFDVRTVHDRISWQAYRTIFVVASVHLGRHEREMRRFVTNYRHELEAAGAALLSLSLSQAGAQDEAAPPDRRRQACNDVRRMIDAFAADTGWTPAHTLPVAGALAYTKYNFLVKLAMKQIARHNGASTDTSRDWEFTDWQAIDGFVRFVLEHAALARAS
jgi:menaquinone-dependent protoporphyrinogen oxidase